MSLLRLKDFNSPKDFFENHFMFQGMSPSYGGYPSKSEEQLTYTLATEKMFHENSSQDFSVLEIGSGLGNFYKFLNSKSGKNLKYTGIDFNSKVNQAARLYYDAKFIDADFYEIPHDKKYDFVFCFGVAGIEESFAPIIESCYSLCKISCAIQIFERHPFLNCYTKETQLKLMKNHLFISGYRHTENSLIWFGKR